MSENLLCWRCKPEPCCYDGPTRPGWVITNHGRGVIQAGLNIEGFTIEVSAVASPGFGDWTIWEGPERSLRGVKRGKIPDSTALVVDVQRAAEVAMRAVVAERREHLTAVLARLDELGE